MKKKYLFVFIGFSLISLNTIDDLISTLSIRLDQYSKLNYQENVCLILNQQTYSIHDTVFFSAYYYNSNLLPIKEKRIFSVGLVSETSQLVSKINIAILNGQSFNQIPIPSNTIPGIYQLVVFDPDKKQIFFTKDLKITNRKRIVPNLLKTKSLHYNFEGGHFTVGIPNRMVIHARPLEQVKIVNDKKEIIETISTDSSGFASISINPKLNETYSLLSSTNEERIPNPDLEGCSLLIENQNDQKKIHVIVPTNSKEIRKENFILLVHHQKIIASSIISFDGEGQFNYLINNSDLPNGVIHMVVLNESKVLAERAFFNYQQKLAVKVSVSKNSFTTREKGEASLSIKDLAGNPVAGIFTVTIQHSQAKQELGSLLSEENFILNPILGNYQNYLPNKKDERINAINKILVLQEWRPIPWLDLLNNKITKNPRTDKLVLNGNVTFSELGKTMPDSTLISCFLQNSMIGYEGRVKNGKIEIPLLYDLYGKEDVFFSIESKNKDFANRYSVSLDSVNPVFHPYYTSQESNDEDTYGELSHKRRLVMDSYQFFQKKPLSSDQSNSLNDRFEEEAMGSDLQVKVDEYVVFPTMADLVKEVIPFLEIKSKKNSKIVRLLINQKKFYSRPKVGPLFVIDGAMTKEQDIFLDLKPIDIYTIKIINDANKLTPFGALGKNGIVLVQTKQKKSEKIIDRSKTQSFLGLNEASSYSSQNNFSASNNRIPDVRPNLLWLPLSETSLMGEAKIKFNCSDLTGQFMIVVSGKTKAGIPFQASTEFVVE